MVVIDQTRDDEEKWIASMRVKIIDKFKEKMNGFDLGSPESSTPVNKPIDHLQREDSVDLASETQEKITLIRDLIQLVEQKIKQHREMFRKVSDRLYEDVNKSPAK